MAIRDEKKHEDEHFPKSCRFNGLPYGWCFLRQLIHVEFNARNKKKEWTMWSPSRIYSTLGALQNLTPMSMEQQDQETSQVGADSDDEDLETEEEDSEGGDKQRPAPAGPADGAKAPSSK
jgi:hypothetical protein